MSFLIETKKLTKIFSNGETTCVALNEVDLQIEKGEYIALVGCSGSGKTTLMYLLGCLDVPSSGSLFLDGREVSSYSTKQLAEIRNQKIGFVFQNFYLLNDLTAVENVMLPQLYGGVKDKVAKEKAENLLEIVGLGHRLSHYPNQLSGGQKQRIAIARALSMDPSIILADEPTGNLDSENAQMIIDIFIKINQLQQTTIILVTHEKEIARQANRCITIQDGKIALDITHKQ